MVKLQDEVKRFLQNLTLVSWSATYLWVDSTGEICLKQYLRDRKTWTISEYAENVDFWYLGVLAVLPIHSCYKCAAQA